MKKLVLLLIAAIVAVSAHAQTSLVATLSHDGNISTYYSSTALKDAYGAAVDGDIITLSAGTFQAVDFTKNVTVRGAGMMADENPTIINEQFNIRIPKTDESKDHSFTIEGLLFYNKCYIYNASNATFLKCFFNVIISYNNTNYYLSNSRFIHCFINDVNFGLETASVSYLNCYIKNFYCRNSDGNSHSFINCIINSFSSKSSFWNCIFINLNSTTTLMTYNSIATGCIYVGNNNNFFNSTTSSTTNRSFPADTKVFKDDSNTYELLDELQTTWLGNDGTQVGIHGGSLPFSPYTTNPRITKFNVAPKTTVDGKLSVDIEVKAN